MELGFNDELKEAQNVGTMMYTTILFFTTMSYKYSQGFQMADCMSVGRARRILWICWAALWWTHWNIMRKFNIGGVFPAQPADDLTCTNLPAGVEPCG
jgi:hypothetical protein